MRIGLFLTLLLLLPPPASADASASTTIEAAPKDPESSRQQNLDRLLGKLHNASPHMDVSRIEQDIWEIWSRNASPTAEVLLRESSAAIAADDYDPAEQMLSQLVETYPTFAEAWNRRASLYYLLRRFDAAMIDIEKALELEPRNFGALVGKGMILHAQHKTDEALAAFKEALAINPHLQVVRDEIKLIENQEPHV